MTERRAITGTELRAEGRRLSGVVLRYGDTSPTHRERFEPGSLRMAAAIPLNLFHDAMRAIAWTPDGGLTLEDGEDALRLDAELPPLPAADAALQMVREGQANGLSIEFRAAADRREGGIRIVSDAELRGIALVRRPSYEQSRVEARARRRRVWL